MAVIATEQRELLDAETGPPVHQQQGQVPGHGQPGRPAPSAAPMRGTDARGGRSAPGGPTPIQRPARPQQAPARPGVRKGDLASLMAIFAPMS